MRPIAPPESASRIARSTSSSIRNVHSFASHGYAAFPRARLPSSSCSHLRKTFQKHQDVHRHQARRTIFTETLPTVLIPPAMFLTCFVGLWSYKIFMTIVFQNKLIYMPYMPPFARSEKVEDYAAACKPVVWQEERINSLDGTRISLCIGNVQNAEKPLSDAEISGHRRTVIIYFQGNGASLPPRLPSLSGIIRTLQQQTTAGQPEFSIVALSYRGFWTSKGRASQKGIELDAQATLAWVQQNYPEAQIVLWGQSLGAGVATHLLDWNLRSSAAPENTDRNPAISGLILETPFIGIKEMLLALYPQKWLPYRYLWPFLRNWWDNPAALRSIASKKGRLSLPIQIVAAGGDEVVPANQADHLHELCQELKFDVRRKNVLGALHNEVPGRPEGRKAIVSFIKEVSG